MISEGTAAGHDDGVAADRLVAAVAAYGLHDSAAAFPAEPLGDGAWHHLYARVQIQRVPGLLAAAVHGGALPTTDEQRRQAFTLHTDWVELCLRLEADLLATGSVLDAAGVPYRVLKGPAFAHLDYPDPSLRVFGDIDLLVPSASYDAAIGALSARGDERRYQEVRRGFDRRFGKGASLTGPAGRATDVHRTFSMGPFGLSIDLGDVWRAASPFPLGGRSLLALDADHRFLHACYHAAVGNVRPRLVPLRDLAGMLQRGHDSVDVDRVLDLARRWRGQAVLARAVGLAWGRFSLAETPLSRWAAGYRPTAPERRALAAYLDPDMGYAARSFAALRVLPGVGQKAAFAWALAFPDRDYGAGRHRGRWQRWRDAAREIARWRRTGRRR